MNPSELRLGNLIQDTESPKTGVVTRLEENIIECDGGFDASLYGYPIRLGLNSIQEFGFTFLKKKPGTQGVYSNGKMNLHVSNSGNIYRVNQLIPYVHTLQNLYFALVEEELEKQ